jgi:hypothetical protein
MPPHMPRPRGWTLQPLPPFEAGSQATTCLRTRGELLFCCVFLDPTTCYFNFVHPDVEPLYPRWACPSSCILTRCVPTRWGRRVTFKPTVGSQTTTTVGMVCPLCRDSTWPTLCRLWIALLSTESRQHSCVVRQDKACWEAEDDDGHTKVFRSCQDQHCAYIVVGYLIVYTQVTVHLLPWLTLNVQHL